MKPNPDERIAGLFDGLELQDNHVTSMTSHLCDTWTTYLGNYGVRDTLDGGWADYDPYYGLSDEKKIFVYVHDITDLKGKLEKAQYDNERISWIKGIDSDNVPTSGGMQIRLNDPANSGDKWKLWWVRVDME